MRKVFLEDLPTKNGQGANKGKRVVDWRKCINSQVGFEFDNIIGTINIIDFTPKTKKLKIEYKNNYFEIRSDYLSNCYLYKVLFSSGEKLKTTRNLKSIKEHSLEDNFNYISNINLEKSEYTYNEVRSLVNDNKVNIIKISNKKVNGVYRMLIELNNEHYIQCTQCEIFKHIDEFTTSKNNINMMCKSGACKNCCNRISKQKYYNNYERYIYYRYKSLEQNSKKRNVEYLSFEDFKTFAETNKDPIYNVTLKEAFEKGIYDKVDVDHKIPISKGGNSLIDNLYLISSDFNRLKLDKPLDETLAIIKLLYEKSEDIKQFYNTEEVKL